MKYGIIVNSNISPCHSDSLTVFNIIHNLTNYLLHTNNEVFVLCNKSDNYMGSLFLYEDKDELPSRHTIIDRNKNLLTTNYKIKNFLNLGFDHIFNFSSNPFILLYREVLKVKMTTTILSFKKIQHETIKSCYLSKGHNYIFHCKKLYRKYSFLSAKSKLVDVGINIKKYGHTYHYAENYLCWIGKNYGSNDGLLKSISLCEKLGIPLKVMPTICDFEYYKNYIQSKLKMSQFCQVIVSSDFKIRNEIFRNSKGIVYSNIEASGTPFVCLEALASGVPIVTRNKKIFARKRYKAAVYRYSANSHDFMKLYKRLIFVSKKHCRDIVKIYHSPYKMALSYLKFANEYHQSILHAS